jgi:hypothetical protein
MKYKNKNNITKCNKQMTLIFVIIVLLFLNTKLIAQVSLPNEIHPLKVSEIIKVDGKLDEECWKNVEKITNFHQRELDNGKPVTEPTQVAIVYTADKMYLGVWCFDSDPAGLTNKCMKRDFVYWTDDNFEVVFDTYLDHRNGYVFVINPNGARADVLVTDNGSGFNPDWNGIWDAQVLCNDKGWFAEIEIPFSTFKYPEKDTMDWGVNFERNIRRKREAAFWQGWSRDYDFEHVSHAGKLIGLAGIQGKELIEFKPFITSGIDNNPGVSLGKVFKIGGDLNYLITPTLKLNLTANTDFAQIESDRAQINLTRFNLYYQEKRDFFLEGKNNFEFNIGSLAQFFYSRRIGINNDGNEIPIIGGARILGKTGNTELGVLSIQTAQKDNEPTTNYSVIRVNQDIFEKSKIGMIITAKNQFGHNNYVYGTDANYKSSDFLGNKNLFLAASIAQSQTKEFAGGDNLAMVADVNYPNETVSAELAYVNIQKNFNPEIGFLQRDNYKYIGSHITYNPHIDSLPLIRKLFFTPYTINTYWTDNSNKLESIYLTVKPIGIETYSGEYFDFTIERDFERIDSDFNIHDSINIPKGSYWFTSYSLYFKSFEGRHFVLESGFSTGNFYDGHATYQWSNLTWSSSRHINISADYSLNFVYLPERNFRTTNIGGRFEYAFNPKLISSFFGQWNNDDKQILLNIRLHWIPIVGSDAYLALNQTISTLNNRYEFLNTIILGKFIWRFSI